MGKALLKDAREWVLGSIDFVDVDGRRVDPQDAGASVSNAMSTSSLTPPELRNGAWMTNITTRAAVERECAENLTRAVEALKTERRKADAYCMFGLYQTRFPDPREEIARLNEVVTLYRDLAGSLGDKLDEAEKERDALLAQRENPTAWCAIGKGGWGVGCEVSPYLDDASRWHAEGKTVFPLYQ